MMVDNIITNYSISSKQIKIMSILIRKNQNLISNVDQNEYEKIKDRSTKKLHRLGGKEGITGKILSLKGSIPLNHGKRLDLVHLVWLYQMFYV